MLKDYADRIQIQLQRVKDVGKVELLGLQDEKIWIELSNTKLATLGLSLAAVQQALQEQNAVSTAGFFETPSERLQLRVSGRFDSVEQIRQFPLRVGERTLRIGDVADVHRGFNDPPAPRMRFMGENAIGLAVSMKDGGETCRWAWSCARSRTSPQRSRPGSANSSKCWSRRWSSSCWSASSPWACAPAWWWHWPFRWCWR